MARGASYISISSNQSSDRSERAKTTVLPIPKVLVLYTGGTIGMKSENNVYVPHPQYMEQALRELVIMNDPEECAKMQKYDTYMDFLYLKPQMKQSAIAYYIMEYAPLLDSSCMRLQEYETIVNDIKEHYNYYDGFLVLHGTDTMAYTASYISFMFENLDKPVVFTGSQIPIFEARSDGRDNLICGLLVAGQCNIPEVTIMFNNKLYRGNRAVKVDCQGLHAFETPNFPPLAEFGLNLQVRWDVVLPKINHDGLKVFTDMSLNVGMIRIFPGLNPTMISRFCSSPLEAIIIQTYGMGNVPTDNKEFMQAIEEVVKDNKIIINCTQCVKGCVLSLYETGATLSDLGVISGRDMTIEAVLAKASYVIGHKEWSLEQKKEKFKHNLRGEMTTSNESESSGICSILTETVNCAEAARSGSVELVKAAISVGKSLDTKDTVGFDALYYAIKLKNSDIIEAIRQNYGKLTMTQKEIGIMACEAASKDDVETLKCLRQAGATFSEVDYCGNNAAHVASYCGSKLVLSYLIKINHGLMNIKNGFNLTPKMIIKGKNSKMLKDIYASI